MHGGASSCEGWRWIRIGLANWRISERLFAGQDADTGGLTEDEAERFLRNVQQIQRHRTRTDRSGSNNRNGPA